MNANALPDVNQFRLVLAEYYATAHECDLARARLRQRENVASKKLNHLFQKVAPSYGWNTTDPQHQIDLILTRFGEALFTGTPHERQRQSL